MKLYVYINAVGETFSPKALKHLEGFSCISKNEPQEIVSKGRYQGKPIPFGSLRIAIPVTSIDSFFDNKEAGLITRIETCVESLKKAAATDVSIHLDVEYENQCNLQFNSAWLTAIGKLGIPVAFTAYEV